MRRSKLILTKRASTFSPRVIRGAGKKAGGMTARNTFGGSYFLPVSLVWGRPSGSACSKTSQIYALRWRKIYQVKKNRSPRIPPLHQLLHQSRLRRKYRRGLRLFGETHK